MATSPVYDPSSGTWVTYAPAAAPAAAKPAAAAPATLSAIQKQMQALVAGVAKGAAQAKTDLANAKADQAGVSESNAALAKTLGATVDATGHITPPAGGYTASGLAAVGAGTTLAPVAPAPTAAEIAAQIDAANKAAAQTSAANSLNSILSSYGLTGGISGGVLAMLQNGLDIATIQTILDSPDPMGAVKGLGLTPTQLSAATGLVSSWQTRFSGNQARIAAGLNPLSPADYIANEQSYKQVMTMGGIPTSSPLMSTDYLGKLMAQDVSPAEVASRVSTATAAVKNEDPQVLAQLQTQFGMTMPTILTHLLDPTVAAPLVSQEYAAATIGAEAARAGVNIAYGGTGPLSAMGLAAQGVTQNEANLGFASIAEQQPALDALTSRYQGYGNAENVGQLLEASTFNTQGAAEAKNALDRIKTQEVSAFSGSAGAATGSLGMKDISGLS